jgi:predicted permease
MLIHLKKALRALLRRSRAERELVEELRDHIERQTEQYIRLGMNPDEARYAARKAFGGVEQAKERSRDARGVRWLEELWQDLRYGARMLVKYPGFTALALLTLALGIGVNTAIFSVVNGVLLRPLPFRQPDRLVYVWTTFPSFDSFSASYADFSDWQEQNRVFEGMAAATSFAQNLTTGDETEQVRRLRVSTNFFQVLGVNPILGRAFLPEEEQWGQHRVLILSHGLWQRRFGGYANVLGRQVQLDSIPYTVIGVAPSDLPFPGPPIDLWIPLAFQPGDSTPTPSDRGYRFLRPVIARLRPGVTVEQADQEIKAIAHRLAEQNPVANEQVSVRVVGIADWNTRLVRVALLMLMVAVGFVLLIACINVANLLLARAAVRDGEIAVRMAMGASRGRLLRQLLTESVLLALASAGLGLLLGYWALGAIVAFGPTKDVLRLDQVSLNDQALGFTLGLALLTSLVFGLIPALRTSKPDLLTSLKEGARGSFGGRRGHRIFRSLVVAEVALSMILLVGAGLLIRSFALLQAVELGFDPTDVLAMRLRLNPAKYQNQQAAAFYQQLLSNLEAMPHVKSAGAAFPYAFPLRAGVSNWGLEIEGRLAPSNSAVGWRQVTPNFFRVLGIPLIRGRLFTEQDHRESNLAVIINQTLARRFFSDEDPVGKRIRLGGHQSLMTIVGVVGDTKLGGLNNPDEGLVVYASHSQGWRGSSGEMWVLARTNTDPLSLVGAMKKQIRAMDKDVPVAEITTLRQIIGDSLAERWFNMFLLGILALMALVLAAGGIYGVMAQSVTQRTREIGLRLALGAQAADVLKLVLRQGLSLVLIGMGFGLAGAFALTRVMSDMLFEVKVRDPLTFAIVTLVLTVIALLACYLPARRATRVDPLVALKYE